MSDWVCARVHVGKCVGVHSRPTFIHAQQLLSINVDRLQPTVFCYWSGAELFTGDTTFDLLFERDGRCQWCINKCRGQELVGIPSMRSTCYNHQWQEWVRIASVQSTLTHQSVLTLRQALWLKYSKHKRIATFLSTLLVILNSTSWTLFQFGVGLSNLLSIVFTVLCFFSLAPVYLVSTHFPFSPPSMALFSAEEFL